MDTRDAVRVMLEDLEGQRGVILERQMDAARAKEAGDAFDAILSWAKSAERKQAWSDLLDPKTGRWILPAKALRPYGEEQLNVIFQPGRKQIYFSAETEEHLIRNQPAMMLGLSVLGVDQRSEFEDWTPKLVAILQKLRSEIVHEMTHYVDYKRLGGLAFSKAADYDEGDTPEYYNSPAEMNAYYQMAAEEYWRQYEKLAETTSDPEWDLFEVIEKSTDEAWGEFEAILHRRFWANLTAENKKRLRIRAGQLFLRIKADAARRVLPIYRDNYREQQAAARAGDKDALDWGLEAAKNAYMSVKRYAT